jgi:ADP-ribose pyrophosphatase YjhB (NUDIX family)
VGWTTLTGVGGLVANDGRLLMVRQRRPYGIHWELPSGYYEPGESFEDAAAREVVEETGIDVEVVGMVCTLVWEREHDRRRNVLAFFEAVPVDPGQEPRPQVEEGIDEARWVDPFAFDDGEIHGLEAPIIRRWRDEGAIGFHLHADVTVHPDGTQSYAFRAS